jgi:cyclohexanone monooxygenase
MRTDPVSLSVGIIGAGPGGMALGILLAEVGFRDFTIFDREGDVGGTWLINTYPGLACDVKSHLYSYSFDLNSDWSRLWPAQPEILAYFQRCADKYRLRPHLRLRTEIRSARWDEDTRRWCLTTATGEELHFNVVVSAVGLFTRPLFPDLVEEEPYTGTLMHSSRWDHSVSLEGARVAVLGTGSTASQLVPELAKVAGKVYSVQRSPTWILPKPDRPYSRRERWVFAHIPFAKKLYRTRLRLRSESNISVIEHGSEKTQEFTAIARGLLEKTVADEELRRKLTPDHPMGCKRLVFSSDYLSALIRPNVEVLTSPARYLRARSLVTEDGTERDVDVVVCATGYAAADYLGELDVLGERGTTLREVWRDGAQAYLGMAVPGFPNFFMLYGPNTNVGSNSVIFMLEAQAHYIVRALKYMRRKGKAYIAVRPSALAEFVAKIDRWMVGTVWTTRCSNYFRAANGRVVTQWPRSARSFWGMTHRIEPTDFSFQTPAVSDADAGIAGAAPRLGTQPR